MSAGGYALRFSGGFNNRTVEVTTPEVDGRSMLRLSVVYPHKRLHYEMHYDGDNLAGAAAYIAGQSPHWKSIELYLVSNPGEPLAEWNIQPSGESNVHLTYGIESILQSLRVKRVEVKRLEKKSGGGLRGIGGKTHRRGHTIDYT